MWVVDPGSWGPHCRVLFIKRSNTLLDHTFTNNSYLNKLFGLGGKIYTYVTYVKTSLKSCSKNPPLKDAPLDPFRFIPTNSSDATTFFSKKKTATRSISSSLLWLWAHCLPWMVLASTQSWGSETPESDEGRSRAEAGWSRVAVGCLLMVPKSS